MMINRTLTAAGTALERVYPAADMAIAKTCVSRAVSGATLLRESATIAALNAQPTDSSVIPPARHASSDNGSNTLSLGGPTKSVVVAICLWSLVELPFELDATVSSIQLLALVSLKAILISIGAAAIKDWFFFRRLLCFLCGVSLFAITPALPEELKHSLGPSLLSTIECMLKAGFVLNFCFRSINERRPRGWRDVDLDFAARQAKTREH